MRCKTLNVVCSQLYDTIVGWWSMFRTAYNTSVHFIFPLTPVKPHLLQDVNFSMKYFVNAMSTLVSVVVCLHYGMLFSHYIS